MALDTKVIEIETLEWLNLTIGQTLFIKSGKDLLEAFVSSPTKIKAREIFSLHHELHNAKMYRDTNGDIKQNDLLMKVDIICKIESDVC